MLQVTNLSIKVSDLLIIKQFSLTMNLGECVVLSGPNGSGKSTLIHGLIGHPHYTIESGEIIFCDQVITKLAAYERARLGMLVVLQQQVAIPGLLIIDYFIQLYRVLYDQLLDHATMQERLEHAFVMVGLDLDLLHRSVCEGFSGGQKKRFELAHLLVLHPKMLILDEVDSGLDAAGIDMFKTVIDQAYKTNPELMSLIVTHNQRSVELLKPDRIITLS